MSKLTYDDKINIYKARKNGETRTNLSKKLGAVVQARKNQQQKKK